MKNILKSIGMGLMQLIEGALAAIAFTCSGMVLYNGITENDAARIVFAVLLFALNMFTVYLCGYSLLHSNTGIKIAPGMIVFDTYGTAWLIRCIRIDDHLLTFECKEVTDSNVAKTNIFDINDLGKTLFLTAKEAFAARKEKR